MRLCEGNIIQRRKKMRPVPKARRGAVCQGKGLRVTSTWCLPATAAMKVTWMKDGRPTPAQKDLVAPIEAQQPTHRHCRILLGPLPATQSPSRLEHVRTQRPGTNHRRAVSHASSKMPNKADPMERLRLFMSGCSEPSLASPDFTYMHARTRHAPHACKKHAVVLRSVPQSPRRCLPQSKGSA